MGRCRAGATACSPRSWTGILLSGEKGSGKTLLARLMSIKAREEFNMPTLIVDQPLHGPAFNSFLQSIDQPVVVLFDEFEKVYDDAEEQQGLLSLLDGVYTSKKMFIMTCNDKYAIDKNFTNRPGRLFYMIEFTGLSQEFVTEFCEHRLNNKGYIPQVARIPTFIPDFNFDMLKALVEEMNRFDCEPREALEIMNIKVVADYRNTYEITDLMIDGKRVAAAKLRTKTVKLNHGELMSGGFTINFAYDYKLDDGRTGTTGQQIGISGDDMVNDACSVPDGIYTFAGTESMIDDKDVKWSVVLKRTYLVSVGGDYDYRDYLAA